MGFGGTCQINGMPSLGYVNALPGSQPYSSCLYTSQLDCAHPQRMGLHTDMRPHTHTFTLQPPVMSSNNTLFASQFIQTQPLPCVGTMAHGVQPLTRHC